MLALGILFIILPNFRPCGSGSCFENRSSVSTVNVGVDYSSHLNDGCAAGVLELAVPQGVMGNGNSGHPGHGFHLQEGMG